MRHEDPEKAAVLAQIAKRRNIYLILYIVFFILMGVGELISDYIAYGCAVLMGVFSGFAIICITNYKYIATGGRNPPPRRRRPQGGRVRPVYEHSSDRREKDRLLEHPGGAPTGQRRAPGGKGPEP